MKSEVLIVETLPLTSSTSKISKNITLHMEISKRVIIYRKLSQILNKVSFEKLLEKLLEIRN